jgi:hypothetical protein
MQPLVVAILLGCGLARAVVSDRAESKDVAKEHPEIVARLSKLAPEWKATLPEQPDPSCISKTSRTKGKASQKRKKE